MDEQNPRLSGERMTGRSDEALSGYDTSSVDPRTPEAYPAAAAPASRVTTRNTTTPGLEPRTTEIRAEIEQTREEMSETVNAIQERLRPSNIAANAADTVREAARERVRDVADSDSVQYVRANPIPTAMVGIGLAGLAWLAFGGNEGRGYSRQRYFRGSRDWDRGFDQDRFRGYGNQGSYAGSGTYSGTESAGAYGTGSGYTESDAYYQQPSAGANWDTSRTGEGWNTGRAGDNWTTGRTGQLADRTQEISNRARNSASRAQYRAQQTWNENPLLVAAASALLGAVIGAAIPETERENQLMGEARDGLVESVQETVKDKVGQVQQAATSAVNTVQETARAVTGMTSDSPSSTNQSGTTNQSATTTQPGTTAGKQPRSIDTGRS